MTSPDELRPLLHKAVDTFDDVELETMHRLILRMRMEQSLDRLPQIIAEVRARRRAGQA